MEVDKMQSEGSKSKRKEEDITKYSSDDSDSSASSDSTVSDF
jgi:hypothetical protein